MSDHEHSDTESVKAKRREAKREKKERDAGSTKTPKTPKKASKAIPLPTPQQDDEDEDEQQAELDKIMGDALAPAARAESPVPYNGMDHAGIKRKSREEEDEKEEDHEESEKAPTEAASSSSSAAAAAASSPPDDGSWLQLRNTVKQVVTSIPEGTNFSNPNNTLRYFSIKHKLRVHWTEVNPATDFIMTYEKPKPPFTKAFFSVKCIKPQKFDFTGGTNFKPPPFNRAIVVGAFCVVKYPRMYPYGDRDPIPNSKYGAPDDVSKIKYKLPCTNMDYASNLATEKPGVGLVDSDADLWLSKWARMGFDKWVPKAAWSADAGAFENGRKLLQAKVNTDFKNKENEYKEACEEYIRNGKKGEKPKKPDLSDKAREAALRNEFIRSAFRASVLENEKTHYEHVNINQVLLKGQTVKDREAKKEPALPADEWFIKQFKAPPMWEDKKEKKMKPGFPKLMVDIPLLRCVTADEATELHRNKRSMPSCVRLVPRENRFIVDDDVVAPVHEFDHYDTKVGCGMRWILVATIWLGERNKLNEDRLPVKDVDPTSYFVMAQKYERTKENFNPNTVENSDAQPAANSNAAATAAARSDYETNEEYADFASE